MCQQLRKAGVAGALNPAEGVSHHVGMRPGDRGHRPQGGLSADVATGPGGAPALSTLTIDHSDPGHTGSS